MKRDPLFLLLITFCLTAFLQTQAYGRSTDEDITLLYRGRVIEAAEPEERSYEGSELISIIQPVEVLVLEGALKGEVISAEYTLNYGFDGKYQAALLKPGTQVFLMPEETDTGGRAAYVIEIARDRYLLYLAIVFVLLLLLVGRSKGLKAVISLALTVFAIFYVLMPAILRGFNPILVSSLICVGIIIVTLVIIGGTSAKTLSAIIGTSGGVIVAGAIALAIGTLADLTGLSTNETRMLMYIPGDIHFDFRGLLFSGILIGAMGATMDVGMSISSAMHEIKENSPGISKPDLIKSGMNVGRDAMATMANTLILAYVGSSMQVILLFMAYDYSLAMLVNWDMIASEILRALAGSIGIIAAIPITALVSAFVAPVHNFPQ